MRALDEFQRAAATATGNRILVTASAGTGKTTTLTARIAYMVNELRISPSTIVAMTFTKMAAKEIKVRVGNASRGMFIGTLHSFCLKLLMEHGAHLNYEREWLTIIPDEDAQLDQREILADMGMIKPKPDGGYNWKDVKASEWQSFVQAVTSGMDDPSDGDPLHDRMRAAWANYVARLRSQNTLTFATLLTETWELLQDRSIIMAVRERYRHILLDECQDSSKLDWSIIWRMIESINPATLFVVGDDWQAIYNFRGSAPDIMVGLAKKPEYQVFNLANSYRFGPGICEPSLRLIRCNPNQIEKQVIPKGPPPGTVHLWPNAGMEDAVNVIASLVHGLGSRNVAVICRRHAPLEALSAALTARGIDHARIGNLRRLQGTSEFRAVMGYLRLAANQWDRRAFMAITATEGIPEAEIRAIRQAALGTGLSLREAYGATLPSTLDEIKSHVHTKDPHANYESALEYLTTIAYFEGLTTAQELVNHVAMMDLQDEVAQAHDKLCLMTCHAAKGLEFPAIVILACNEGLMPDKRSTAEGNIEEERRIMYVAMTRAKSELHIIVAREDFMAGPDPSGRPGRAKEINPEPSRFIAEAKIS